MQTPLALRIILDEHHALSVLLQSMSMLVRKGPGDQADRFFDSLRAMLFYIDEFPERLHHKKETELLFPMVAARDANTQEAIAKLDLDHSKGESAVRELQHLLMGWEFMGESRRAQFEEVFSRYLVFYRARMELEEKLILPAAKANLTPSDWLSLDAAFAANRDALTGKYPVEEGYERLFSYIARVAPAPIGLGS